MPGDRCEDCTHEIARHYRWSVSWEGTPRRWKTRSGDKCSICEFNETPSFAHRFNVPAGYVAHFDGLRHVVITKKALEAIER